MQDSFYQLLPFSETIFYLQGSQPYFGASLVTLQQFDINSTFAPVGKPNQVLLQYLTALADPSTNTLIGCAELPSGDFNPVTIDLTTFVATPTSNSFCPIGAYYTGTNKLKMSQPLIQATAVGKIINVTISPFDNPQIPVSSVILQNGYATQLISDGANAFVFSRLWSDQSDSNAYQFSYEKGKLVLLDTVAVPSGYIVFFEQWPPIQFSASATMQEVAVPASVSGGAGMVILVYKYDNQPSEVILGSF